MRIKKNKRNERKMARFQTSDKAFLLNQLKSTDNVILNTLDAVNRNEKHVDRYCHKKYGHSLNYMASLTGRQYQKMKNKVENH